MNQDLLAASNVAAQSIIDNITQIIIQPIVYLLFSIGLLLFMWGLVEFIANPTNASIKEKGKQHMIFGILGLLIMFSVWGIVGLVTSTIGVDCGNIGDGKPCSPSDSTRVPPVISPDRSSGPF
jgi:hypothetical protein